MLELMMRLGWKMMGVGDAVDDAPLVDDAAGPLISSRRRQAS
jgi:hypothetical protein